MGVDACARLQIPPKKAIVLGIAQTSMLANHENEVPHETENITGKKANPKGKPNPMRKGENPRPIRAYIPWLQRCEWRP